MFFCLLFAFDLIWAFDPNTPHPHPRSLIPFSQAPEPVALSAVQNSKLQDGETILLTVQDSSARGRGIAVQYIDAPEKVVWDTILAYDIYPQRVKNVVRASIYDRKEGNIYVALISQVLWVEFGVYTINSIYKEEKYMSWELDRRRTSDAEDLIGYWRIEQIQSDPPKTRVDFASKVALRGVPQFLEDYLREDSLRNGTAWVKKYAEESYKANQGDSSMK